MSTQSFHIGDVLSVTTGILLSPEGIGGVHHFLDYMTNDTLFTHQLPRAVDECRPSLKEQHPDLFDIEIPKLHGQEECNAFLATLYPTLGEYRDVAPLEYRQHTQIDPISELLMMKPDAKIIVVKTDD
jgi:hypothetical protein